jgi:TolB-like protein
MPRSEIYRQACPELSASVIYSQLTRILNSRTLARAGYLTRFLKGCVEQTLAGNSGQLKEIWLGSAVFHRKGEFNPTRDPIVRVQARRLREKLALYYETEGVTDTVRITLPVGSYVPVFSTIDLSQWAAVSTGRTCSIAVLPLTPLGGDSECSRFADSMTVELTHALVEIGGLEVVSRTSAFAFKGVAQDIRSIGRSLDADFIVEGCVRLADDRHRITLQLTATETGYHCWGAWFEQRNTRMAPDARRIAELLRHELSVSGINSSVPLQLTAAASAN